MQSLRFCTVALMAALLVGVAMLQDACACAWSGAPVADPGVVPIPAHGLHLPASFRGDLPCADCEGVRHHLDLWPDQVFHLRREWLGRDLVRGDIGRWRVDPGRRALILQGGAEMPLQFEILADGRLRQLDLQGNPIVSDLPYELDSEGGLDPADVALLLGGEMTQRADGTRFEECLTGRSYAIAPGPEAARLQRAYQGAVRGPGAPLYVSFEGTLTQRNALAGNDRAPAVTVERFINTWPGQSCARARADASLTNTYWRIVRLFGEAVAATPNRPEPHVVLRAVEQGVSYAATVGCNQLIGSVETTADGITFRRAATTLMACPPPLAELEQRLGELLEGSWRWQILGSTLELKDADGKAVALFEAVYF
jgi:heat shock protein HslJ